MRIGIYTAILCISFWPAALAFCEQPSNLAETDDHLASIANTVLKPSKPLSDDYFPCSDCHEDEPTNFKRRKLKEEHTDIKLTHSRRWCLDCHNADNRDVLHLVDGSTIPFTESWKLCVQCHGKKLPDWRLGLHGKRTGHWNGTIYYETCVTCHNPHHPKFRSLKPKPAPLRPEQITYPLKKLIESEVKHERKKRKDKKKEL